MDQEIQFGELEHSDPETSRRPDRNKHFHVCPVFAPSEEDLPIFVDIDAMRDMEEHALTDTSVELGGVLLGGQYYDEQGRPFVLVTDSLRAAHYEATKGSFKFTHDTWQQIGRERDEFPEEVQMVGWYHTHPDWGVFLSGMDMFICDNFFNKPLDLALVIDPCRGDRGFFQWTDALEQRVRRTTGFYLIASRFRQGELEEFAEWLEGKTTMSTDPRFRSAGAAPVVNVVAPQQQWQALAVMGMLAMQFCFLALLAWRTLLPAQIEPMNQPRSQDALWSVTQAKEQAIQGQIETLDSVIAQLGAGPAGLVETLAIRDREAQELRDNVAAHRAYEKSLQEQIAAIELSAADSKDRETRLNGQVESLRDTVARLEATGETQLEELDQLQKQVDGEVVAGWRWQWLVAGAVAGLIVAGGILATSQWKEELPVHDEVSEESS